MSRRSTLALLPALALVAGCVVTGRLDPAGGARLTIDMRLVSVIHFDAMKAGLQSDYVTLKNATMTPKKWATFEIECSDVQKLATAPVFAHTNVSLIDAGKGAQSLAVRLANIAPQRFSEATYRYSGGNLKISLELPGDVMRSNGSSTAARTVTWTFPLGNVSTLDHLDLLATFGPKTGAS